MGVVVLMHVIPINAVSPILIILLIFALLFILVQL